MSSASWPTIVAEALDAVPEPLATALCPGPAAPAAEVAAALARCLAPEETSIDCPPWLRPEQRAVVRRAIAAVRRYGGALLADPVGTGKTYVGLAVAVALNRRKPTVCFVPAALVEQWTAVARRLDLPVVVWSHERVSRGVLPKGSGGFVLIDESHHYRNPSTHRYRCLAPWLVGRTALLLSATPVVNRMTDLAHQLHLVVRDDALAPSGVPSLGRLLENGQSHVALGQVILSRSALGTDRPAAREHAICFTDRDLAPIAATLEGLERLRLSSNPAIANLIRGAFWRAAASSPAALVTALRRYRRLLLHAGDAARAGKHPDRRELLRLTDGLADQLVLWELVPAESGGAALADEAGETDLALDDLQGLEQLLFGAARAASGPDPKLFRLEALLTDGRPTLVFTTARETVRYLRERLGGRPIAWCTGERAGIGRHPAARQSVLQWFRPARLGNGAAHPLESELDLAPLHLITTDVAAEGLDLHRAERIVHYDLPWTPMRLEQRAGRVIRAGSMHRSVEIVHFEPPPAVEARLRQLELLHSKRRLPIATGLGDEGRALWRWRADLAADFAGAPAIEGIAAVPIGPPGMLVGFALHGWPSPADAPALAACVLWWDPVSGWSEAPTVVVERLRAAASQREASAAADKAVVDQALTRLAPVIRERIAALERGRWIPVPPGGAARRLVARLQRFVRLAARRRDAHALDLLHRALRFAAGGHTAGEETLVERAARLSEPALWAQLPRLPAPTVTPETTQPRLTGLILFAE